MPDCHLEADAVASSMATIEGLVAQYNALTLQLNAETALLSDRMAILEACLNGGMGMAQDTKTKKKQVHPILQRIRDRASACWNSAALGQANIRQFIEKMLAI